MEQLLSKYDAILPKKRHYYIETVYSQYIHAHGKESIDKAREIISKYYPEYIQSFDKCMNKRSLHLYSMFIMKKDVFNDYCDFLFDILNKVEKEIELTNRVLGFLGERILNIYFNNKKNYKELYIINRERINWIVKLIRFIKRKYD